MCKAHSANGVTTTTCTVTYTYASGSARGVVVAIATIHGRTRVMARGFIKHRKLRLRFTHLTRGHYRLTLLEVPRHGQPVAIGHTSITVS
jgi:hypothetical protein